MKIKIKKKKKNHTTTPIRGISCLNWVANPLYVRFVYRFFPQIIREMMYRAHMDLLSLKILTRELLSNLAGRLGHEILNLLLVQ